MMRSAHRGVRAICLALMGNATMVAWEKSSTIARINFIYPWVAHASHPRSIRKRFKERACSLLLMLHASHPSKPKARITQRVRGRAHRGCKPLSFVPKVLAIRDSFLIFLIRFPFLYYKYKKVNQNKIELKDPHPRTAMLCSILFSSKKGRQLIPFLWLSFLIL